MRLLSSFLEPTSFASGEGDGLFGAFKSAVNKMENAASSQPVSKPPLTKGVGVNCNWLDLQLGNNVGHWVGDRPGIKYSYDHDLKGLEIRYWWPGRASGGECNDTTNPGRGCWYRARMLNDPSCDEKNHCLHVAAHDGEPAHTYTCPTWVRNHEGMPCNLPLDWQYCPEKFNLLRIDSGIPQEFKEAISKPCGPMGEDHCLGNTEFETETGMYFDLRVNQWYRCTPWMKCERFDIQDINYVGQGGTCGEETCKKDQACFNHKITSKNSTMHCMDKDRIYVVSSGDDMAEAAMPLDFAIWAGFPGSVHAAPAMPALSKSVHRHHKRSDVQSRVRRLQSNGFL